MTACFGDLRECVALWDTCEEWAVWVGHRHPPGWCRRSRPPGSGIDIRCGELLATLVCAIRTWSSLASPRIRCQRESMSPTISIITVAYNSERHLSQTIASVASQSFTDREFIVVDGRSTDGTPEIVRRERLQVDRFLSEPDRGIADAMNKGLRLAEGDYVLFLHSDDYLLGPDSLADVAPHLADSQAIVAFRLFYEAENGERVLPRRPKLNWRINFKMSLDHQAVFCRSSVLRDLGGFDPTLKIAMDYDFFLRAYRRGIKAASHDLPIAVMRKTGISSRLDRGGLLDRLREEKRVHLRHADTVIWKAIYGAYWLAYPIYRGFHPRRDFPPSS